MYPLCRRPGLPQLISATAVGKCPRLNSSASDKWSESERACKTKERRNETERGNFPTAATETYKTESCNWHDQEAKIRSYYTVKNKGSKVKKPQWNIFAEEMKLIPGTTTISGC